MLFQRTSSKTECMMEADIPYISKQLFFGTSAPLKVHHVQISSLLGLKAKIHCGLLHPGFIPIVL